MVCRRPFAGGQAVTSGVYRWGVLAQFFATGKPPAPLDQLATVAAAGHDLVGEWTSAVSKNGVLVMRQVNGESRAAYRAGNGGFAGRIDPAGVLREWGCEEPARQRHDDAGQVGWRLLKTKGNDPVRLDGRWRYGEREPLRAGGASEKVGPIER